MFLIQSIRCRAVYFTLMLRVMVDITALCQKCSKESRHCHCRGRQSVNERRHKFKLRTLKRLSDGKEQLQTVKIRIQKLLFHCVVQHRVQESIQLTTIFRIPSAKPPKSFSSHALKVVNTVGRFEELLSWL